MKPGLVKVGPPDTNRNLTCVSVESSDVIRGERGCGPPGRRCGMGKRKERSERRDDRSGTSGARDRRLELQLLAYTAMHPEDLSSEEMTFLRIRFGQLVRRLA
jgi:hypothetical protein